MRTEVHPVDALAGEAASTIAAWLHAGIVERGVAALALSGGSTPVPTIGRLATIGLDWSRVWVCQVDERQVERRHPDRNWAAIDDLLVGPTGAHGVALTVAPGARDTARRLLARQDHQRLRTVLDRAGGAFDVVQLGLGADGHTASWPPGRPIPTGPELVAPVARFAGHERITLTLPAIASARAIVWIVAGADKAGPLAELRAGTGDAPALAVPRDRAVVLADTPGARPDVEPVALD